MIFSKFCKHNKSNEKNNLTFLRAGAGLGIDKSSLTGYSRWTMWGAVVGERHRLLSVILVKVSERERQRQKNKRDFLSHRLVGLTTQSVYMWMWYYHQTPFSHFLRFFGSLPFPSHSFYFFILFFPLFSFLSLVLNFLITFIFTHFFCTFIIITSPPMFPNNFLARYKCKYYTLIILVNKFSSFSVIFFH